MSADFRLTREQLLDDVEQLSCAASHELKDPLREALLMIDALGILDHRTVAIKDRLHQVIRRADQVRHYSALLKHTVSGDERADLSIALAHAEKHKDTTGLKVATARLPVITGNQRLWNDLFTELLRNALRHNDSLQPEMRVETSCTASQRIIRFTDNGVGIAPEHRAMIFGLFRRCSDSHEPDAGAGCGLAHCRRIVQLHGGEIYAFSQPGQGSEFRIVLPVESATPPIDAPLLHDIAVTF